MNNNTNNTRVAKNTLLLYLRMFFSVLVGLYTSRIVINTLGINDYGIYNIVGGIITMLAFLNSAMTASSQRFISYELGRNNKEKLRDVFSTSIIIHLIIALLVLLLAETFGLWFLNNKINIPENRMYAANWVYQCSIFSFILMVISVPYNACIVAHEHMNAFAYISILEMFLKLIIVYLLHLFDSDKLILYAIFLFIVALIIRFIYVDYCKRRFTECIFSCNFNKRLFRKMSSFAGWSLVGNLGFALKDQGSNIVLNMFYGVALNAARGIALQVNSVVSYFFSSFLMAINPQITKQFAQGNIKESISLVYRACKFSLFLVSIIAIPLMINIDYVLSLWLGVVPVYTSEFLFYALWVAIINSMTGPLVTAIQATGHIMLFQITIFIIMALEMPIAYIILKCGFQPHYIMIGSLLITFIGLIVRFLLLRNLIHEYNTSYFLIKIVFKNILIVLCCYILSFYIRNTLSDSFLAFIFSSIISFVITVLFIYWIGITKNERTFLSNKFVLCFSKIYNRIRIN